MDMASLPSSESHCDCECSSMIRQFEGETAVNFIRQVAQSRRELRDNCRMQLWLTEHEVTCYVLSEDNRVLSFALLSAGSADGCGRVVNYIYTVEAQRNRGLASLLLRRIQEDSALDARPVTAVCWNDIAERIFYKTGFSIKGIVDGYALYKYP